MTKAFYVFIVLLVSSIAVAQDGGDPIRDAVSAGQTMVVNTTKAVELALANNFSVQKGNQDVAIARRSYTSRWNDIIPDVTASVRLSYSFNEASLTSPLAPSQDDWFIAPNLGVSLSLSADIVARWQQLRLQYTVQEITQEALRLSIEKDVRKLILDVLLQQEVIKNAENQIAVSQELKEQTDSAYRSGLQDEYTALRAELQAEQDAVTLIRQRTRYAQLLDNFKFILGLPQDLDLEVEGELVVDVALVGQTMQNYTSEARILSRPDVQAMYTQLEFYRKQKLLYELLFVPRLSIGYDISPSFSGNVWSSALFEGNSWTNTNGTLTFALSWAVTSLLPTSDVFTQRYSAVQAIEKQNMAIEEKIDSAKVTAKQLYNNILSGLELIRTNEINLDIAARAARLAREAFTSGLRTYDQVQQSEQSERMARLVLLEEQRNVLQNIAEWSYVTNSPEVLEEIFLSE